MKNLLNKKLLDLLSNVDKTKLDNVSKMLGNMSKEDINNLTKTLNKTLNKQKD